MINQSNIIKMATMSLLFIAILLSFTSCQTIDVRGQYISSEHIKTINDNKMTSQEVVNLIGTPNYIPDYNDKTWFYIQRSISRRSVFPVSIIGQRIVKLVFDEDWIVSNIELITDSHKDKVTITDEYTKTPGIEQNTLQKFVKNVGRFNKQSKKTKRQKNAKKK